MTVFRSIAVGTLVAGLLLGGCRASGKSARTNAKIDSSAKKELATIEKDQPSLDQFLDDAHGYAIFPVVAKGGIIVGGSYAWGVVYEHGERVGYADMIQGTVGAQVGGQTATEIIVFKDKDAFERFKTDKITFAQNMTAVILSHGATKAPELKYNEGVAVFLYPKEGAMAEAVVGGQTFLYRAQPVAN